METERPPFETQVQPFGADAISAAAALIAQGQCVAVPTETVYGLAADATDGKAVAGIYTAKGRPSFNPRDLAGRLWPGPLTLVLPLRPESGIASLATAGLQTIALRVPAHPAMQALLAACGKPLAAPSANASGSISPTSAAHVLKSLGGRIPAIIVAVAEDGTLRLLRPGPIDLGLALSDTGAIEAPGQLASHYAPAKPLRLNVTKAGPDEWLIGFGEVQGDATLSGGGDPAEAAANLFDALHTAEDSEKPRIAVAPILARGLGIAINDRLSRAAA